MQRNNKQRTEIERRRSIQRDELRRRRQRLKELVPKKVNVTAVGSRGFCKYGRVQGGRGTQSEFVMVVPIEGNQNDNWKIG